MFGYQVNMKIVIVTFRIDDSCIAHFGEVMIASRTLAVVVCTFSTDEPAHLYIC